MPGKSDQLRVARMIDRFDAGDKLHQPGIVLLDMLNQLRFCIGRTGYENRAGIGDRFSDRMKEFVISRSMTAADRICLVVDVLGRMVRMQDELIDIGRIEMKYARLLVVDPDNGMKVMLTHGIRSYSDTLDAVCPISPKDL